jgi:hypothetical protein
LCRVRIENDAKPDMFSHIQVNADPISPAGNGIPPLNLLL